MSRVSFRVSKRVVKDVEAKSPQIERLVACMVLQWQECLLTLNFSPVTIEVVVFPMVHFGAEVRSGQQTKLWLENSCNSA